MATNDFFHGVQGFVARVEGKPVTAVRSSVIGAVVTAGKGPVNVPTLIFGSTAAAFTKFGPYLQDGFTAGHTAKAIFEQIGTLVVFVNVCDPAVHNEDAANEIISLSRFTGKGSAAKRYFVGDPTFSTTISAPVKLDADSEWTVPTGCTVTGVKVAKGGTVIPQTTGDDHWAVASGTLTLTSTTADKFAEATVWVTYTATLVKDTDYTVNSDLGQFQRLNTSSKLLPEADITVSYTYVDPSKVTTADIVGAQATADDAAKGIFALRGAPTYPGVLTKPKLLIAPGFSDQLSVATELNNTARKLGAEAIVDAPNTLEESVDYALNFSGENDRVSVHYPLYYTTHPVTAATDAVVPASPYLAGSQAAVDKKFGGPGGGDPCESLSNKPINGITGLTRAVPHTVTNFGETDGESEQQFLNSQNVITTIMEGGWRAYGNTKCNGNFLCVDRMADYVIESVVLALIWAIDRGIKGPALLDQIITVVRHFLRRLESRGSLIANPDPDSDNDVWFPEDLNTPDVVSQGTAYLNFRMNPPPPLQRLVVTGQVTHEFLKRLFQQDAA